MPLTQFSHQLFFLSWLRCSAIDIAGDPKMGFGENRYNFPIKTNQETAWLTDAISERIFKKIYRYRFKIQVLPVI